MLHAFGNNSLLAPLQMKGLVFETVVIQYAQQRIPNYSINMLLFNSPKQDVLNDH